MIFIKDEIPSHNTHDRLFMYKLKLNRLDVNFKLSIIFKFHVEESIVYIIITNKNKLCLFPLGGCWCQVYFCVSTSSDSGFTQCQYFYTISTSFIILNILSGFLHDITIKLLRQLVCYNCFSLQILLLYFHVTY